MEQQSTPSTPSKRQDFVQYTPQIVTNFNQQYDDQQHDQGGLGSPSQEHYEDSMLELKDVDNTLPSNYSFLSHNQQQQQFTPVQVPFATMPSHQQPMYLPSEREQRVYETPTNNNYIHSGSMNPNVIHNMTSSYGQPSNDSKYSSWTRVVLIFAVLLGVYGCFGLVSQFLIIVSMMTNWSVVEGEFSIPSLIVGILLSTVEIAAGSVGVWSTTTKNPRHRRGATIAHLVLLSITTLVSIVSGIIANLQILSPDAETTQQISSTGINPQHLLYIMILSIFFYVLIIFACCGSCIGCQAYRFKIMSRLQADTTQSESTSREGFMVMRDEV